MKVKVLRTFKDKNTNTINAKGVEIEVTEKRFKEINSTRYGTLVESVGKSVASKTVASKK